MARNGQSNTPEQLRLSFSSPFLTINQGAALIGVPKFFIYRRTSRGHGDPIPHYRLERKRLVGDTGFEPMTSAV